MCSDDQPHASLPYFSRLLIVAQSGLRFFELAVVIGDHPNRHTATDKNKRYITSLHENDIRVLEDGVPQKVFTFQRETDRPLSIAFLIDVSISEERTLPDEKAAARAFIENIIRSEKDQAAIVPFEGYAHVEQPLTRNVLAIYKTLERVEVAFPAYIGGAPAISGISSGPGTVAPPPEGSTAIWDSVFVTCRYVLARDYEQRRRAIILLTDGRDTTSRTRRPGRRSRPG